PPLANTPFSFVASHGILSRLDCYGEIVRVGILLHGLEPSERGRLDADRLARADLRPIAVWKARVADVRTAAAGEQVGYALRPALAAATRVATLAVGWADGYPTAMSRGGAVLLDGRRCPVLAVSANCTMVDVSRLADVAIGDQATLLGGQGAEEITAGEFARMAGTGVYQVLASVPAHTPRYWA
ncbi:MAG: alanine racemase C-terminal domain-containing protein, partial [Anaerolineae bacterium]